MKSASKCGTEQMNEGTKATGKALIIGVSSILFAVAAMSGCSGAAAEACDTTDDCFQGEFCDDGYCTENDDPGPGNGSENNGTGGNNGGTNNDTGGANNDTGGTNNDSGGTNDAESCPIPAPCNSGVDSSINTQTGLAIRPDDPEYERFGCDGEDDEFISGDPDPIEVQACPHHDQRFRVYVRPCDDRAFVGFVELRPLDDACPVDDDWGDVEIAIDGFNGVCDTAGQAFCREKERPDHGGYRWQLNFGMDPYTAYWDVRIKVEAGAGVAYRYEIDVSFPD